MRQFVIVDNAVMVQTNDAQYNLTEYFGIDYRGYCYIDDRVVGFVVRDDDLQFMCHFTETTEEIIRGRTVVIL